MTKRLPKLSAQPTSVRLTPAQRLQLAAAARETGLSQHDCLRKAVEFGLPRLVKALGGSKSPRPVSAQTENRKLKTLLA